MGTVKLCDTRMLLVPVSVEQLATPSTTKTGKTPIHPSIGVCSQCAPNQNCSPNHVLRKTQVESFAQLNTADRVLDDSATPHDIRIP